MASWHETLNAQAESSLPHAGLPGRVDAHVLPGLPLACALNVFGSSVGNQAVTGSASSLAPSKGRAIQVKGRAFAFRATSPLPVRRAEGVLPRLSDPPARRPNLSANGGGSLNRRGRRA